MQGFPQTKYPNGFNRGVEIRRMPVLNAYSKQIWWVDSNAQSSGQGTFVQPYTTLSQAYTNAALAVGDEIHVKAGHAETISAAAGLAHSTVGVSVIGYGYGNKRPTFTFASSTAATWTVTAAAARIVNIIGTTSVDQVVSPWVVSAADVTMDVEWRDGSSVLESTIDVLTTAAADRFTLYLKHLGFTAGSHNISAVRLVGCDGGRVYVDFFGVATTAVVQFSTTACTNIDVQGRFHVSGTSNFSKNVVDTVTGSTWTVTGFDAVAAAYFSGGDAAAVAGDDMTVPSADSTANAAERDVVGNKTDASVYVPGSTNSLTAYMKGHADLQHRVAVKSAATMVNGQTIFTVAGGPIKIEALWSECVTANNCVASTLQFSCTPTAGSAQTISGASGSLANAAIGATVTLAGTALATAALLNANGPNLIANPGTIVAPAGTITMVIATGSTTGTWRHRIRFTPLATGVTVS